ncbi:hypothetical protein CCR80_08285 [Rhodothalassium salexigens]|uniref:heparinase II/III family protein n=1 Tax=Rhodothalassium salexigens TaxID=1086 RepID=UPI0019121DA8|nr:heparinase II/III family protein [Rhodothalassium salexigens]MBK5921028.1 hypothetical protein [Rhodothalassium salexigens]
MFRTALLTLRTLPHLKRRQITNRLRRKLVKPRVDTAPVGDPAKLVAEPVAFIAAPLAYHGGTEFTFLNQRHTLDLPAGWTSPERSKLWRYHLHYFDWLSQDPAPDAGAARAMITRWIDDNPPLSGDGWEPYPISRRLAAWVKWLTLRRARGDRGLEPAQWSSLGLQARVLAQSLEYHLMGNHLWANAKGLIAAGLALAGDEARGWLDTGRALLDQQLDEQVLDDGGHYERSPTYHALLLEDLADLINLSRAYGEPVPARWVETAQAMLAWLVAMTRPDGRLPLFNDAAHGAGPSPQALRAYAERLGLTVPDAPGDGLVALARSGYFRYAAPGWWLVADAGAIGPDHIPGHAHADMLSFELSVDGRPLIVDTGTSTYEAGARRAVERGTAAHNTVEVAGTDQSEMWGAFRVARRARLRERHWGNDRLRAAHDGYDRLGVRHARYFTFAPDALTLTDTLTDTRTGRASDAPAVARLHFAPGVRVVQDGATITADALRIEIRGADRITLADYHHAPDFNTLVPARVAEIAFTSRLETRISR